MFSATFGVLLLFYVHVVLFYVLLILIVSHTNCLWSWNKIGMAIIVPSYVKRGTLKSILLDG